MGKTLILGNNSEAKWLSDFPDTEIRKINNFTINRDNEIVQFVESLPKDLENILIDSDSVQDTDLVLNLALRIRLEIFNLLHTSLSKIIIVSSSSLDTFTGHGVGSILLMTSEVYVSSGEEALLVVENNSPLSPSEYIEGFLNLIKIVPNEKVEGRHSIANEWGADILAKMISGGMQDNVVKIKLTASLYFRYCRVISLNASDVASIIECKPYEHFGKALKINMLFNYLLIDDEAEKGWDKVLELMMPNAKSRVYCHKAENYNALPQDLRNEIEACKYDIVFLDLRMMGIEEERQQLKPQDFSGYKILNSIKEINPGIQVIMLTATNKGWNIKALLDAGANGFYIKESPEYHFSLSYSYQNAESFTNAINGCLKDAYLKVIWKKLRNGIKILNENRDLADLYRVIKLNWESAFILLTQHQYRDALLQLTLALEAYVNKYTFEDIKNHYALGYKKSVNFNDIDEEDEVCIFDTESSFYKITYGIFRGFQRGSKYHAIKIVSEEDKSEKRVDSLTLPLRIAAVTDIQLNTLENIDRICELIFIRNNRLAHHGVNSEYIEEKRPITSEDCQIIFDLTYELIIA